MILLLVYYVLKNIWYKIIGKYNLHHFTVTIDTTVQVFTVHVRSINIIQYNVQYVHHKD